MLGIIIVLSIALLISLGFVVLLIVSKGSLEEKLKKSRSAYNELKNNNDILSENISKKDLIICSYEGKLRGVESVNAANEQLLKENKELQNANNKLQDENSKLDSALKAKEKVDDGKSEIAGRDKRIEEQKNKIDELLLNISSLSESNKTIQASVVQLQKQNSDLCNQNNTLTSENNKHKSEIEKLREEVGKKNEPDIDLISKKNELARKADELSAVIVKKDSLIAELEKENQRLNQEVERLTSVSKPPVPSVLPAQIVLFKDGEYNETLSNLGNVSDIIAFLKDSDYEKAPRYLKQVNQYIDEVEELNDVFARLDEDEDEMSMACINKFSKIFNEYIAENILEPAFKAKDEEAFYSDLVDIVMSYLTRCGIYSKEVVVGSKFEKINYMEIIAEETKDIEKHKIISRVISLPFFATYTSDTGKVKEKLLSKGSCVVYKAR